jgi:citrate synthase
MISSQPPWIAAVEAATLLGVNRATLYAYVSRGHIRSQAVPGSPRARSYSRDDVERMRRRTEERRAPDRAAGRTLQWGMPILESAIALIDGERLYYRGIDAATLARSRTLEDVASLIWTGGAAAAAHETALGVTRSHHRAFTARAQSMLIDAAGRDHSAGDLRPSNVALTGSRILRILAEAAAGRAGAGATTVHSGLARAWNIGPRGADVVRAALVLCADHELNVSSFTARCVASAGAHPYAVVIAALGALEGPRHGGAGRRVEAMLDSLQHERDLRGALAARLRRGESIDGFGHPLYPGGDPRARLLLRLLGERYPRSPEYRFLSQVASAATATTGDQPNIDFALAAIAHVLRLPPGSPLMLFAVGRSVGWIGHAIEQYATGQLIRPRARYVGVPPDRPEAHDSAAAQR